MTAKLAANDASPDRAAWRVTPQQKRREATIDRLIESAKFVLQRDGQAMFTLRAVATHAGMRLSNLQHYFESKEHLLIETARQAIDEALERHRGYHAEQAGDPVKVLGRMLDHALAVMVDPLYAGVFLELWVLSRHSPEVKVILVERFQDYFDLVTDLVAAINPMLDRKTAAAMAFIQIGMIEGTIIPATTLKDFQSDIPLLRDLILRSWQALWAVPPKPLMPT